jgi:Helix-turn-helix domain
MTKEYLTIEELSALLNLKPKTVKNKMAAGVFQRGIHYFRPRGLHPRFKWSAIVAWLEEKDKQITEQPTDAVPMARGYLLGSGKKSSIPLDSQYDGH